MNDLERAGRRFGPKGRRKVAKKVTKAKPTKLAELRADQFRALWVAIERAGFKYLKNTYTGDGWAERMFTEMANEVGKVALQIAANPNLELRLGDHGERSYVGK